MNLLRLVIYLVMAALGYQAAVWLEQGGLLQPADEQVFPLSRFYLALVGGLIGVLLWPRLTLENRWHQLYRRIGQLPPEVTVALTVASTVGLLVTVLLSNLLSQFPGFSVGHSLVLAVVMIGVFSVLALANRVYFRPSTLPSRPVGGKVLDTSVLIDGRVVEIAEQGFLDGPLWAPRFMLRELQGHADSHDPQRRVRGRRGLEVLEKLKGLVTLEVVEDLPTSQLPVDEQLLEVARSRQAALITNDTALQQLARIYGIKVLSVQALSVALRNPHASGDLMRLVIVKEGRDPGQGVGYLDDGTMVVVEDALPFRGQEVEVVLTQTIQTQVGRLLFGRLAQRRVGRS